MLEEPTFTEEEEKLIWIEQNKTKGKDPRGFRCFLIFMIASGLIFWSTEVRASGGITWLQEESVWSSEWSCSACGNTNGEEYSSCNACGGSK